MKTYKELLEDIEVVSAADVPKATKKGWKDITSHFNRTKKTNLGEIHPGYTMHREDHDHGTSYYIHHTGSNQVVGHVSTGTQGKDVHIAGVDVHPHHTSKHIGASLPVEAYRHLHRNGYNVHADDRQSVGGAKIWHRMMRDPELSKHIQARQPSKKSQSAAKMDTRKIWGTHSPAVRSKMELRHGIRVDDSRFPNKPGAKRGIYTTLRLKGKKK